MSREKEDKLAKILTGLIHEVIANDKSGYADIGITNTRLSGNIIFTEYEEKEYVAVVGVVSMKK